MTIKKISPDNFSKILTENDDVFILDVRTNLECRTQKISRNCIFIPLHELNGVEFKNKYENSLKEKPVYIVCRSGSRAMKAAQEISQHLSNDIIVVEGGINDCAQCNIPMITGKTISLERQVRIAAGGFIVLGGILGLSVNEIFYFIPTIIGGGLVFAGITDKCGLALCLARAPWNKPPSHDDISKSIQLFEERKNG